jgi:putative oxidoreductase
LPTTGGPGLPLPGPILGHSYGATRGIIGKSAAQIPNSAANALTLTRVTSHSHDATWRRPDESSAPTAGRPAGASLVDPEDDLPSANYAGDYETTTIPYYSARTDNAPLAGSRYGLANTHEALPYAQPSPEHHDPAFGPADTDADLEHDRAPLDGRRGTQDLGLLVLRVGLGVVLVAHGLQKLFGWWGGEGLTGFRNSLSDIGYQHADILTYCAAGGEIAAGVLLVLGLFTPLAAAGALAYLINGLLRRRSWLVAPAVHRILRRAAGGRRRGHRGLGVAQRRQPGGLTSFSGTGSAPARHWPRSTAAASQKSPPATVVRCRR